MNTIRRSWLACLLAILALLWVAACGDDDDDDTTADDDISDDDVADDDVTDDDLADDDLTDDDIIDDDTPSPAEPFIEEGKKYLRAGAGGLARVQFVLGEEADPDHEGCWYGIVLSDILQDFDVVSIIYAYVEMVLGYQPPAMKDDPPETGQGFVDDLINLVLDGLLIEHSQELVEYAERLEQERPEVIFELDRMPIIMNFEEIADAHGDFDLAEAVAAESVARMLSGSVEHATALNLDFNLGLLFELENINWGGMPIDELIGLIVDYGLMLLDDPVFPDFFTLKGDGEPYRAAGLNMGLGFRRAAETYALILAEQSSQENEVLGYDDFNGDQQWQESEHLVAPPWDVLDDEQNDLAWAFHELFTQLADSFLDYTEYDSDPENAQPFQLYYLNTLLEALNLPPLIPDWDFLEIDFGASYRDADPTNLRDTLVGILHILDLFFP